MRLRPHRVDLAGVLRHRLLRQPCPTVRSRASIVVGVAIATPLPMRDPAGRHRPTAPATAGSPRAGTSRRVRGIGQCVRATCGSRVVDVRLERGRVSPADLVPVRAARRRGPPAARRGGASRLPRCPGPGEVVIMSGRLLASTVTSVVCVSKSTRSSMPADSTSRRSSLSPHSPRTEVRVSALPSLRASRWTSVVAACVSFDSARSMVRSCSSAAARPFSASMTRCSGVERCGEQLGLASVSFLWRWAFWSCSSRSARPMRLQARACQFAAAAPSAPRRAGLPSAT